jgi:hypothetical protein
MSNPIRPQYMNDPLLHRVVELERQVSQLSQRASMRNAEMRGGAFSILDPADGVERLRLGTQADGKTALVVFDDDGTEQVRFGELVGGGFGGEFNLAVDDDPSAIGRNVAGFGDGTLLFSGSLATGPEVTLETGSRVLVFTSCRVQCNNNTGAETSFRLNGATVSPSNADVGRWSFLSNFGTGGAVTASVSRMHIQAVNPGLNTFVMEYQTGGSSAVAFDHRTIAVLPL